ncbi:MAG: hypothetical protein JSW11_05310 [Candidatus Heimdallarchaeota archaeon]|nr:MAG: hypothetical protein JSW11_05310 [Candidatus Heimdallarchaeota archaeon]
MGIKQLRISPDANGDLTVDIAYSIAGGANNLDQSPSTTRNHLVLGVLLNPRIGEILSGEVTVQWIAIDLLEHNITYSVSYSPDRGKNWILLETGLRNPFYTWDTTTVDDGAQYLIQIIAYCSEGARCVFSSDIPFTIDNLRHIHHFSISTPGNGDVIRGTINILWTGEDVFGHLVTFNVSLSSNKGVTWIDIGTTTELSWLWDSTTVPDGDRYVIQVTALCSEGSWCTPSRVAFSIANWPDWKLSNTLTSPSLTSFDQAAPLLNTIPLIQLLEFGSVLFFVLTLVIVVRCQQSK